MRYIIAPLDLSDEQSHIYKLLYKKADFKTMIVKYTKGQLLLDSNSIFNLTERKIRTILEYFLKENFIKEIEKGSKGNPTIYEIITVKELLLERQLNVSNVSAICQLNVSNVIDVEPITEVERQSKVSNVSAMRQSNVNPIKEKDNEEGKGLIDIVPYKEIIDYLNLKANTKYKHTGNKTKELIKTRYTEKFTLEDFKTVINKKCNEWIGTEQEKYLRPETIFGNKFEGYLNQKGGVNNGTDIKQNQRESKTQYDFSSLRG